jgi:AraC-like DNA-binding protein
VVPASVEHELDFFGKRTLVLYLEPHVPGYGAVHRGAAGRCVSLPALDVQWQRAVAAWQERESCDALLTSLNQLLAQAGTPIDSRVRKLCRSFNQGELLDATTAELASQVALSPSRLVHLFTSELGAGVRRVKQHYRFKLAVACIAQTRSFTSGAHSGGFADSSHFSRAFRGTFGVSPSEVLLRTTRWLKAREGQEVVIGG